MHERRRLLGAGPLGQVFASTDGGATWTNGAAVTSNNLSGISCDGPQTCVAVGENGTILSADEEATVSALTSSRVVQPLGRLMRPLYTLAASPRSFASAGPIAAVGYGAGVIVADETGRRLIELTTNGTVVRTWGSAGDGNGQFSPTYMPSIGGVAIAPDGNIYATDPWHGRVEEFSPNGSFVRSWGTLSLERNDTKASHMYGPRGIAIGLDGDVYVADTGHDRVQVFTSTGTFVRSMGHLGNKPGELNEPSSIAIDGSGRIVVADFWNARVVLFDADGTYHSEFGVPAWQPGGYDDPQITVDGTDTVFVPDSNGSNVLAYAETGALQYEWGNAVVPGEFMRPQYVTATINEQVLVSDSASNQISCFTP